MDTTWSSSSFASGTDRVEWRIEAGRVELRHGGHADQGTLVLSRAEWQAFVAAAQSGQAGAIAY